MAHTNRLAESHLQDVMIVISHLSILYVFFLIFTDSCHVQYITLTTLYVCVRYTLRSFSKITL